MIIAGLDISLTSPGIVRAILNDDTLDITSKTWIGFTTVMKDYKKCIGNLLFYKKFSNYFERSMWMRDTMMDFLFAAGSVDYAAIEDYPYAGGVTGRIFHIAGFTEILKLTLYQRNIALRWYDITLIKKLATDRGNADKLAMYDAFVALPLENRIDISMLPPVQNPKGKSPTSDVIDAFYIMKLLQTELKLRRGLLSLKNMSESMNWIFNRVTKTADENILTREFIKKV